MQLLRSITEQHVQTQGMDLVLQNVVKDGKVTDPYQLLVLGQLSEFFKDGLKSANLELEGPTSFNNAGTSSVVKAALQGMSDLEHVALAQYLLDCINAGECMLHNKSSNVVDWMHMILRHQK